MKPISADHRVSASILALACGAGAAPAVGQGSPNTFLFEVSNIITPEQPSATITMYASFDSKWFAFGSSQALTVACEPGSGRFSDPEALLFQKQYCYPGDVSPDGSRVIHILLWQWHLLWGQFAETDNPLAVWRATWTTDDFTPRQAPIWTESKTYFVYTNDLGAWHDFYGEDFSEGAGLITIIPAPGAAVVGCGVLLGMGARRRRRWRAEGAWRSHESTAPHTHRRGLRRGGVAGVGP